MTQTLFLDFKCLFFILPDDFYLFIYLQVMRAKESLREAQFEADLEEAEALRLEEEVRDFLSNKFSTEVVLMFEVCILFAAQKAGSRGWRGE